MKRKHQKSIYLATAVTILLTSTLLGCSGSEERQAKYLQRANELYADENYEKAQLEVKNVLQINPKNSEARVVLARIFLKQKSFRQAFANFKAAAEEDPKNVDSRVELAKIYFLSEENDKSKEYVDQALVLDPKNKEARIIRSSLLLRSGEFNQAETIAREVLSEYPDESGAIAILVNMYGKTDPYKALDIVDRGLSISPKDEKLKNIKIQVLTQLKDSEGVKKLLEQLVEENPQRINYYYKLAAGYVRSNNPKKVEEILALAIKNNPDNNDAKFRLVDYINRQRGAQAGISKMEEFMRANPQKYALREALVQLHLGIGQREQAVALLTELINSDKLSGDALRARNSLAELALLDNDKQTAEKYLQEIFEFEPSNADALTTQSRIKIAEGDLKGAVADLRAALKVDSESINALKLLAFVQERDGSSTLALDSYIRITELNHSDEAAYYNAGRLSLAEGKVENAKVFLERAVELQPLSLESVTLLSRILVREHKWEEAREHVQPLIENEPSKADGIILLANIYRSENNWEYATGLYRQALELAPTKSEAIAGYVDTYLVNKDIEGAIVFLTKHIEENPDLNFAKDLLAQMHLRNNNSEPAIKIYQEIIASKPATELAYQKLANIYQNIGNYKLAEKALKDGLAHTNSSTALRLLLANLYQQQNQFEQAKHEYEAVVDDRKDLKIAKNNLAMLLINRFPSEENYSRAMRLTADFQDSKNPTFLDTLGWVHYHMNNLPQAISYLQAAVDRQKDNSEYRYHLGMAYHKSGQDVKAKEQLALAIKNSAQQFDGFEEAKATLDKLQES